MKHIFVYNPRSGSSIDISTLRQHMRTYGLKVDIWLPINQQFNKKLRSYVKKKCLVYVYGGDGTISSVASILAYTSSVLVPLPGGTLNHFSKDVGVEQELEVVLAQLKEHIDVRVDIASVNETYFINNSSIGIYARSLEVREKLENRLPKWPAAFVANVHVLFRFKRYRMMIDGKSVRSPLLFVGNNRYSFTFGKLGARSSLTRGVMTLVVTHAFTRLETIVAGVRLIIGGGPKQAQLTITYPDNFSVSIKNSYVIVSHDGEMSRMPTPLVYKVHQKALRIRIPNTSKAEKK